METEQAASAQEAQQQVLAPSSLAVLAGPMDHKQAAQIADQADQPLTAVEAPEYLRLIAALYHQVGY